MRKPIAALLGSVCVFIATLAPSLRASSPIGAVVQSLDYDAGKGVTTVHILNISHKEISALDLSFQVTFPDGTVSTLGCCFFGIDLFEGITQGKGGLAPGATLDQEFRGEAGPVQATVDMVVYSDGTADVLNEHAFKTLTADRKASVRALQKVNELLNSALTDSAVQHPSVTVVAQLKSLEGTIGQHNDEGAGRYALELKGAIQNLTNLSGSPRLTEPAFEGNQLRARIKSNEDQILAMLPHTQLVKAVQQ